MQKSLLRQMTCQISLHTDCIFLPASGTWTCCCDGTTIWRTGRHTFGLILLDASNIEEEKGGLDGSQYLQDMWSSRSG